MQLTSGSDTRGPVEERAPSLAARANHPAVPGVLAFFGWLGYVLARWQIWADGHLTLFIMAGHTYTHLMKTNFSW